MKKVMLLATVLIFVFSIVNSACTQPSSTTIDQHPSVKAPEFTLSDLDGNQVSLSDFKGKVVILDFWATWCPPCRKEIPHFIELEKEYTDQGLVVVGVSLDQGGVEVVQGFVNKTSNMDYTVLWLDQRSSTQAQISQEYQNILTPSERGGIPFTFIIDRDGYVRNQFVGYREKSVFQDEILPLLEEGKSSLKK